ncbi:MAG: hypothetical protein K6T31_10460 [Alicyclobacillus sp.]|nr:hypothetical protein [Alicyclobacillus sp.]
MPIANCKRCNRLFNKVRRDICPVCVAEEDKAFEVVRAYLREHRDATIGEVAEQTGVDVALIIALIQDGRLILRDNPNIHYPCERCGAPTRAGRFCSTCAKQLSEELTQAARAVRQRPPANPDAKSRYYSQ